MDVKIYKFEMDIVKVSTNEFFSREHWTKRNNLKDEYYWRVASLGLKFKCEKPCTITFDFFFKGNLLDCDNNSVMGKCITDALVKQGILIDDNPKFVKKVSYTSDKADSDYVKITILEDD